MGKIIEMAPVVDAGVFLGVVAIAFDIGWITVLVLLRTDSEGGERCILPSEVHFGNPTELMKDCFS